MGGGSVIVPLLVLWLGYGEREATGTSLAAIVCIAAFAAAVQAGYGNVRVVDGLLVGDSGGRRGAAGRVAAAASADAHDRAAVRGRAGRERGGAAGAMIGAIVIGLAAGVVAGLLGVGGGVLFVPGLVIFLSLTQHQAEATSLLAIVPVALVGALRQDRYGNVRRRDGLLLGLFSVAGAAGGRGTRERRLGQGAAGRFRAVHAARGGAAGPQDVARRRRRRPELAPKGSRLRRMGLDNPLHIAFLVVILLLVFGARRLPEIGRSLGGGMREFKDSISGEAKQLSPMGQQPPVQPGAGAAGRAAARGAASTAGRAA